MPLSNHGARDPLRRLALPAKRFGTVSSYISALRLTQSHQILSSPGALSLIERERETRLAEVSDKPSLVGSCCVSEVAFLLLFETSFSGRIFVESG